MILQKLKLHQRELAALIGLAFVTTPVFWLTNLDWQAAALFYRPEHGGGDWPLQNWWLWRFLYNYGPLLTYLVLAGALLIVLCGYGLPELARWRRPALYVLMVIALGPGLVINVVFKDHWGRPRPVHVGEFGGQYAYVPPLQRVNTPQKSFPCGHCTIGYMFFALYFLSRKRKAFYFILTLTLALMIAIARMSAGGHFISDVLWSGYLVFLVAWALYYGWYVKKPSQVFVYATSRDEKSSGSAWHNYAAKKKSAE
jgi:lipid A 4'-phosphatase